MAHSPQMAWKVYYTRRNLTGMEYTNNMPMVAAVTSIDTPTGTKLLGIGVSVYNDSTEQD